MNEYNDCIKCSYVRKDENGERYCEKIKLPIFLALSKCKKINEEEK